jgi:hypothetical protein
MPTSIKNVIGTIVSTSLGFALTTIASTSHAQSLQRPVNAPANQEVSLGDLARQANPGRDVVGNRVYTNADLKLRPAPVVVNTPAFPEIAPARGILEHPGVPEVQPDLAPAQGVPLWDFLPGDFYVPFPSGRSNRQGRFLKPGEGLHDRFGIFTPGFGLRSTALGPPLNARFDQFALKGSPKGGGKSHSGGKGGGKK